MEHIIEEVQGNTQLLTKSQLLMWVGQELSNDTPLYNMVMVFDFKSNIKPIHFQSAFQALVKRSDALRTIFLLENGVPKQRVRVGFPVQHDFFDWSSQSIVDNKKKFKNWMVDRNQQMFNLQECAYDSILIKLSENNFVWYLNQHHLITDAWAFSVLFKAMAALYHCSLTDTWEDAPGIPTFKKYITYENNLRLASNREGSQEYWKSKLNKLPSPPKLYGQACQTAKSKSNRVSIELGYERSNKLRLMTEDVNIRHWTKDLSLFNIFLTTLYAYLYRISDQQLLTIGVPSHNRPTAEFKNTPGVFMEVFPVLAKVEKGNSFLELFQNVRIETNNLLRHAQPGMSSPDLSRGYNVLLNYINASFPNFNDIPTQSEWIHTGHSDPRHHLCLAIHDLNAEGNFRLDFDFNAQIIPANRQEESIQHFIQLLDAFLLDPTQAIAKVDILSKKEKNLLLNQGNASNAISPCDETILTQFANQVIKTPNVPAVVFERDRIDFATLDSKANQLANYLQDLGVKPKEKVGLFIGRSVDLIVGILGILKAGAAYLPMDPIYPEDRLGFMIEDGAVTTLVTQECLNKKIPNFTGRSVCLDIAWDVIDKFPVSPPEISITPEHLAYVIYTSGSTGKPKGSMIKHANVVQLVKGLYRQIYAQYEEQLNVALIAPCVFDASVQQIFGALLQGHCLHIAPECARKDGADLYDFFVESQIDISDGTPAHLRLLIQRAKGKKMPKHFVIGGEAMPGGLIKQFHEHFLQNKYIITNIYGVAECCVDSLAFDVIMENEIDYHAEIPIGKPLQLERTYIMNDEGLLQPFGTPGELCLGGAGVGLGYLNLPALTNEKFQEDTFWKGERMYKTGDLAKFLPDGNIQFIGRKDNQVKVHGYRIELGEIENQLRMFNLTKKIKDVIVVDRKDETGNTYLCAYFVANQKLTVSALRNHLSSNLPTYMIPTQFMQLESFPLTSNGKIDKKSLPLPDTTRPSLEKSYVAPQTEFEEILAEIWSKLLKVEKIGVHDNFLELGGHSLTAIGLTARINETFDLELPLHIIFKKPTISVYAKYIEETIKKLLLEMNDTQIED